MYINIYVCIYKYKIHTYIYVYEYRMICLCFIRENYENLTGPKIQKYIWKHMINHVKYVNVQSLKRHWNIWEYKISCIICSCGTCRCRFFGLAMGRMRCGCLALEQTSCTHGNHGITEKIWIIYIIYIIDKWTKWINWTNIGVKGVIIITWFEWFKSWLKNLIINSQQIGYHMKAKK